MKLTESINRELNEEAVETSLYDRILNVVSTEEVHDENLVMAIGEDSIRIRNEETNKEVWIKLTDTDDDILNKILSTFAVEADENELAEAMPGDGDGVSEKENMSKDLLNKYAKEFNSFLGDVWNKMNEHLRRVNVKLLLNRFISENPEVKDCIEEFTRELEGNNFSTEAMVFPELVQNVIEGRDLNIWEGDELEEASLWDSLPDEFKGKIAGANQVVDRIQSIQGVNATAEVSGNDMVITLTGDMLKAMDAVDVLSNVAKQQNLKVSTNYDAKKFTIKITQ